MISSVESVEVSTIADAKVSADASIAAAASEDAFEAADAVPSTENEGIKPELFKAVVKGSSLLATSPAVEFSPEDSSTCQFIDDGIPPFGRPGDFIRRLWR